MANQRLHYEDFRRLRKGEAGYSATKRTYVSPGTGEVIPRSLFIKLARGETYAKSIQRRRILGGEVRRQKPRRDKGKKRTHVKTKSKKRYQERMEVAKRNYLATLNEGKGAGERVGEVPNEFYAEYDKLKHPGQYPKKDVARAWQKLFGDAAYDYPEGESP